MAYEINAPLENDINMQTVKSEIIILLCFPKHNAIEHRLKATNG